MKSIRKKISVIVPTHNRKEILKRTISSLLQQSLSPEDYQIVVIDDGSTDGTGEMMGLNFKKELDDRICYLSQPNQGPNGARNLGIASASGDILLFINDDTIPDDRLLELHQNEHATYPEDPVSILGQVMWSNQQSVTPLMKWLDHGGPLFSFYKISGHREVPWHFFVTSNVSVKKKFLSVIGPFDEDFREAHDDTEFAWRAKRYGMRLIYCEDALTFHVHPQTFDKVINKMVLVGEMTSLLLHKYPELMGHFRKSLYQRRMFKLMIGCFGIEFWSSLCKELENRWIIHRLFIEVLRYYYLKGYRERERLGGAEP
jgi:glycosyltransferase involved in cell wall biosynthesis